MRALTAGPRRVWIARVRTWILLSLASAAPAHADDCDLLDPATGTGATQIAKAMDNALVNGCAGGVCPMDLPSPREPHSIFVGGAATAGTIGRARGRTRTAGTPRCARAASTT